MPKLRHRIDTGYSNPELRRLISGVIRRGSKPRRQIVGELTTRLGYRITLHMLNAWTGESRKSARFPAELIEPFCEVVADDRLQRFVLSDRLRKLVSLGEAAAEVLDERARKLLLAESRKRRK